MESTTYQICLYLYSAFSVPTIFISGGEKITFEFPPSDKISEREQAFAEISKSFCSAKNPDLFSFSPSNLFGRVSVNDSADSIIIGPLSNDSFVSSPLSSNFFEKDYGFTEYRTLSGISNSPTFNLISASNLIAFVHHLINGEVISINDHFSYLNLSSLHKTYQTKTNQMMIKKENESRHNTYYLEEEMLTYIRRGQSEKLIRFMENKMSIYPIRAGKMANSPLRQEKNIFLAALIKVGNQAAIPGGMNIEDAYELIDTYSVECENLVSIDEIGKLHYRMLLDFCENVKRSQPRAAISQETKKIIDFITEHTNVPLSLDDIVSFSGKSKSYVTKLFKKEVGTSVGDFVNTERLNESKDLLTYTNMSISEIANYLAYANQSHFQNSFKKHFGETPNNYRKKVNAQAPHNSLS